MAATRPRRTFAAPVIITVAASCSNSKPEPPPPNSQSSLRGPTWEVRMENMKCVAHERANPPPPARAIECPPGMSGKTVMTVTQLGEASCALVPAGCGEPACARPKVACPLPVGQALVRELGHVWIVEKRGADCHAEEDEAHADCPPGKDCNPPAPRTFPCPPGVTEDRPLRIAELPDATCVIAPEGCADTSCATEPIACPKR